MRQGLIDLTLDTLQLKLALEMRTEPHILAMLLPTYWASFIRNGPIEDVKPLGVAAKP